MIRTLIVLGLVMPTLMTSCNNHHQEAGDIPYPETAKTDTVDTYFGVDVHDPYRWLEDDRSAETTQWVKAQNDLAFGYLEHIPYRDRVLERLEELYDYERLSAP